MRHHNPYANPAPRAPLPAPQPPPPPPPQQQRQRDDDNEQDNEFDDLVAQWSTEDVLTKLFREGHRIALLPAVAQLKGSDLATLLAAPPATTPHWADEALAQSTRDAHRRALNSAAKIPPDLLDAPLATALSETLSRRRAERSWTWATALKNLCYLQGALSLLPMYRRVAHGIALRHDTVWQQTVQATQRRVREEKPDAVGKTGTQAPESPSTVGPALRSTSNYEALSRPVGNLRVPSRTAEREAILDLDLRVGSRFKIIWRVRQTADTDAGPWETSECQVTDIVEDPDTSTSRFRTQFLWEGIPCDGQLPLQWEFEVVQHHPLAPS
jgi:hypothetical protein